jgi:hypothetical protein
MTSKGVIQGYTDGSFKPAKNLTRAEFAALISRFINVSDEYSVRSFSDLSESHWAYGDIMALCDKGIMKGYDDGTFRQNKEITRAEVMTVVNRLLGRNPSETELKAYVDNSYKDLDAGKWYYMDVLEAATWHDYTLSDNNEEIEWSNIK